MRPIEELRATAHLCVVGKMPEALAPAEYGIYKGWVEWDKFKATVVWGYNENGWEHVSVSPMNKRKLPGWDDMCRLKDMFWGKDVTVVQFHPAEDAYVHGVNGLENVLHLWRPINGDWSVITEDLIKRL